jgi:hypothetical protein
MIAFTFSDLAPRPPNRSTANAAEMIRDVGDNVLDNVPPKWDHLNPS